MESTHLYEIQKGKTDPIGIYRFRILNNQEVVFISRWEYTSEQEARQSAKEWCHDQGINPKENQ
jgi:uncharacterized protein YegP (UPF0339 family)